MKRNKMFAFPNENASVWTGPWSVHVIVLLYYYMYRSYLFVLREMPRRSKRKRHSQQDKTDTRIAKDKSEDPVSWQTQPCKNTRRRDITGVSDSSWQSQRPDKDNRSDEVTSSAWQTQLGKDTRKEDRTVVTDSSRPAISTSRSEGRSGVTKSACRETAPSDKDTRKGKGSKITESALQTRPGKEH